MAQLFALTGRNLKLYFRDKGAVFFSLLSTFIVIGLMVFFLGDMNIESVEDILSQFPGRDAGADKTNAELLVFVWTCAGILSINAVTVTLAAYTVMIRDRVTGKLNSIYTAPISRITIAGGYMLSAWIASVCVCVLTLFIVELIGVTKGLTIFDFIVHVKLIGMIGANSFAYVGIMYVVALIAQTEGAWSGIGTIIGTLVGFFGGIYIPIGSLSDMIGNIMKCTPVIYGTAMFRKVMMQELLNVTFEGLPAEVNEGYCEVMGIELEVFGTQIGTGQEICILVVCGLVFLLIGATIMKYGKKADR